MAAKQGDKIKVLKKLERNGVKLALGTILNAATDELGGNIFVRCGAAVGPDILIPLAHGEWEKTSG